MHVKIKVGKKKKREKNQNAHWGEKMKYIEITKEIRENYIDKVLEKKDIRRIAKRIYNIENDKTNRNIIGILKKYNVIKEIEKDKYIVVTKSIYEYKEKNRETEIYRLIKKEYPEINFIVWNTASVNEFTLHYVVSNYIIIETEKIAIDLIVNLLKVNYLKKYTIITQDILNNNKELYSNTENIIIVKPLHIKSPLIKEKNKKTISIEKIMLDLYVDKLYIQYQGKELETIYENIFEKYDIDLKRLIKYAEVRTNIKKYKKILNSLNIPEKYKLKEE